VSVKVEFIRDGNHLRVNPETEAFFLELGRLEA